MTQTNEPLATAATRRIESLMAELRRLSLESNAAWSASDLTLIQMRAMAIVQLRQPLTVGALSSAMHMSLASGSALAERLVRAGLLRRRHDEVDRRQVLLELDRDGAALLRRVERHARTRLRNTLAAMGPHELIALTTALGAFLRVFREAAAAPDVPVSRRLFGPQEGEALPTRSARRTSTR